ncbi:Cna B-type domain-containing protein [uncultured Vagococcus sp.]|uniref:DUF7601 domain-containing protein n=1 Tax=uncultured Vagococcus sp. TaxID=189676 RepID=UPI0025896B7A|nr:Cna B-type domain-containing protein [uncultured Vagococcus sp.]
MKKYLKQLTDGIKQAFHRQRILLISVFSLLVVVAITSSTLAWQSTNQQAINTLGIDRVPYPVELLKLAKDKNGNKTETPLEGTIFALYEVKEKSDQQIGGYYKTDKQGKIAVSLPSGNYYFEEITPSPGYTFDQSGDGKIKKRYPFTVTSGESSPLIVTAYNRISTGSLDITKRVVNDDNSPLSVTQKNKDFTFTVLFNDQGTYDYQIDNSDKFYSLKSGESLTLRHGQIASFKDIPVGIHYTVTEKQDIRYISSGENTSGTIKKETSVVSFTNTYLTKTGQLKLRKEVITGDGSKLTLTQKEQPFTFTLIFSDTETLFPYKTKSGKEGTIQSGNTITLTHQDELTINELPIGITYSIKEEESSGVTSGQTHWEGIILSTEPIKINVLNEFKTDVTQTGQLTFEKEVVSEIPNPEEIFSFEVTFGNQETPFTYQIDDGPVFEHTSGDIIQLKAGQRVTFSKLPTGMSYTITELPTPYYQGELTEVSGHILTNQTTSFTFINHDTGQPTLQIQKIGVGKGFDLEELFTFTVYINEKPLKEKIVLKAGETSSEIPLAIGDRWRVVEEPTNDFYEQTNITNSVGQITNINQKVLVTQTNTYTIPPTTLIKGQKHWIIPTEYQEKQPDTIKVKLMIGKQIVEIKEVTGPNWTYEFEVPIYNSVGEKIDYKIEEEPVPGFIGTTDSSSFDITNTYVTPVTSRALTIQKKLTGETPETPSQFNFIMLPNDEVVTITGSGEVTLPSQIFETAGTYTYTIKEQQTGELGYTYDSAVYTWKLVVAEENKALVITEDTLTKDGHPYNEDTLIFTNHFKESKDRKQVINGIKTWHHGSNPTSKQPDSIIVYLLGNGKVVQQKQVSSIDKWTYQFVVPVYDQEGQKINYTIEEEPVPRYQTIISNFDLTNTFIEESKPIKPLKPTDRNDGISPPRRNSRLLQTNEVLNIGLVTLGILILISLGLTYWKKLKSKRENK